jgi:processive 1,2-diacylglycerol beta-glucosyltransferase
LPRVLILSASIGAGHDLPAERLATDLRAHGIEAHVEDSLHAMGRVVEGAIGGASAYTTPAQNRLFDVSHFLGLRFPPTRRLAGRLLQTLGGRGLLELVAARRPDVIVSTYPGATEPLGRLRRAGRLRVPVVSAITDLASLPMWAHPGIDLHLTTHPESRREVLALAGADAEVIAVRGFNPAGFDAPPSRAAARAALGLKPEGGVVLVSGGGWGVGDVPGAVTVALELDPVAVLVLCGSNEDLRARLPADPRVQAFGFTDRMPELMAAADVLVHSTAGLTVLEALICGTRVISYGWGRGHIRANNVAFREFGLAAVAATPAELSTALREALQAPAAPLSSWFELPTAVEILRRRFGVLEQSG